MGKSLPHDKSNRGYLIHELRALMDIPPFWTIESASFVNILSSDGGAVLSQCGWSDYPVGQHMHCMGKIERP